MRGIPGNLCGCELVVPVTKTELALFVGPKSEKAPFEGEERVVRGASSHQGHGRYTWYSFEGDRRSRREGGVSLPAVGPSRGPLQGV